jgi:TolB-like protein/Tfp pilus assembly protein PilF
MVVPRKSQKISKRDPKESRLALVSESRPVLFKFDGFLLNEAERLLLRNGEVVPLTTKVFDILLVLVRNSGRLITKTTLLNEIWPDAFVEEANLSVNIASLRKALGEGPTEHRYIETIPKLGYRFVAQVLRLDANSENAGLGKARISSITRRHIKSEQAFQSLVVLPFENVSDDPNAAYLADGLAESIMNNLSQLSDLRVVGRNTAFRYRGNVDPLTLGRELGVHSVLCGRVLRLAERIVIRTDLVETGEGWQIWGKQYHRKISDVLSVQEEISREICKGLRFQLSLTERQNLTKRYTDNVEAYRLYLKGRYYWSKYDQEGLRKAIQCYKQAIETDPTYALAYAGVADCYYRLSNVYAPTREAMPRARAAALKALEIDPNVSETHAVLGVIKMCYELDWAAAEEEFRKAIKINPNDSIAHQRFGLYFDVLGRFDEARRELELALKIDPLSPQLYASFGAMFFLARDYNSAIGEVQKALELDGKHIPSLYLLGRIYEELGHIERAIALFKKILFLNETPMFTAALGHAYALAGDQRQARHVLAKLEKPSPGSYASGYSKALIHVALGDTGVAFECLEQAYEERCEMITMLKVDPALDIVRSDLRFLKLLRRVGLQN